VPRLTLSIIGVLALMLWAAFSTAHQRAPTRPAIGDTLRDFVITDAGGPVSGGTRFQLGWDRLTDGTGTATYSKAGQALWSDRWADPSAGRASITDLSATALANLPAEAAEQWAQIVGDKESRMTVAAVQTNLRFTPVSDNQVVVDGFRVSVYDVTNGVEYTKTETEMLLAGMCPPSKHPSDKIILKPEIITEIEVGNAVIGRAKITTKLGAEGTVAQFQDLFKRFGTALCNALKELLPESILERLRPHIPCLKK
jgi:hypothetical protein